MSVLEWLTLISLVLSAGAAIIASFKKLIKALKELFAELLEQVILHITAVEQSLSERDSPPTSEATPPPVLPGIGLVRDYGDPSPEIESEEADVEIAQIRESTIV